MRRCRIAKQKVFSHSVDELRFIMLLTQEQVDSYRRKGFLVLDGLFSPAEVELLQAEIPKIFQEDSPRRILERSGAVRSVFAPHTTNEVFRRLSRLKRLVNPVMQLLGSEVYIHQYKVNAKAALEGDQWEWHQDFLYWHKEDGMPISRVLTAAVFLQDVNEFNGPMLVIPASHKEGMIELSPDQKYAGAGADVNGGQREHYADSAFWMPTLTADLKYKINKQILSRILEEKSIFSAKGAAGFVLLFDGNLFHASGSNLSPNDRISIFITYNSVLNTLADVERPRPTFIASRDFTPVVAAPDDTLLAARRERDA
jgi:L-proline 4-hydroxylase